MIIKARMDNGRKRPVLPGEVICPFNMHYHAGDEIEIMLEMIICEDKANKALGGDVV
jgi:hypothetical protein